MKKVLSVIVMSAVAACTAPAMAVEIGDIVPAWIACADREHVEKHIDAYMAGGAAAAQKLFKEDLAADKCVVFPMMLPFTVDALGTERAPVKWSDGDTVTIRAVGRGNVWTVVIEPVEPTT